MELGCRRIENERSTSTEIAIDIDTPEPLVPGKPVPLRFSLTPHPVIFSPGERLRLDLASRTDLLRDSVSNGYEQFDMQVPPLLLAQHDPRRGHQLPRAHPQRLRTLVTTRQGVSRGCGQARRRVVGRPALPATPPFRTSVFGRCPGFRQGDRLPGK
ncbi:MAG: CocE/NonD family hydrolase C-terminal non-catalytic domain-containing protein [Solirubrobacteraceae bacterium]